MIVNGLGVEDGVFHWVLERRVSSGKLLFEQSILRGERLRYVSMRSYGSSSRYLDGGLSSVGEPYVSYGFILGR